MAAALVVEVAMTLEIVSDRAVGRLIRSEVAISSWAKIMVTWNRVSGHNLLRVSSSSTLRSGGFRGAKGLAEYYSSGTTWSKLNESGAVVPAALSRGGHLGLMNESHGGEKNRPR